MNFMRLFQKRVGFLFVFSASLILLLLSCSKKNKKDESNPSVSCYINSPSSKGTCESGGTLTASTKTPLLVVRIQYENACFRSDETTWAKKFFGTSEGQMNGYWNETTYGKYQFTPATESSACANDGIINVNMARTHPNIQKEPLGCYAAEAITAADSYIDFSTYDTDSNGNLSTSELQVIFLVAGGESSGGYNIPGGVWGMNPSMYCDADGDGEVRFEAGESHMTLDNVNLLGSTSQGQNEYSQFGETDGSSPEWSWDAPIGTMSHELGHAFFQLPDLYDTTYKTSGIGYFGLMGSGSAGMKSFNECGLHDPPEIWGKPCSGGTPVHLSAWSKEKLDVCTPQTVSSGTDNYTLATNATTCGIYKISTSTTGEYFLIENRGPAGYDRGFIGLLLDNDTNTMAAENFKGGLAIWHIDNSSNCDYSNACDNSTPNIVDLEEANDADLDNKSSRGRTTHLFYSGNNATFDNSSTPNSKLTSGSSSGISVTNISAPGDNMTFTISK